MSVGKLEKTTVKSIKRPAENNYRFFIGRLDRSTKNEHPLIRREILDAYKDGNLRKSEYLALLREMQRRNPTPKEKEKEKKAKINIDTTKKEKEEKLEKAKGIEIYSENKYREEEERKEKKTEGKISTKPGFFSNVLSNSNFRIGFFVVAVFVLLFVVTKNALSGKGEGELLIFAVVLMGILVIVGSSGSKTESNFF